MRFALVLAFVFSLAGCGGGETSSPEKADSSESLRFKYETKTGTNDLSLAAGQCGALELGVYDYVVGGSEVAPRDIEATVAGALDLGWCKRTSDAVLTVYSDKDCKNSTKSVTIKKGEKTADLWVGASDAACFKMGAKADDIKTPASFYVSVEEPVGDN